MQVLEHSPSSEQRGKPLSIACFDATDAEKWRGATLSYFKVGAFTSQCQNAHACMQGNCILGAFMHHMDSP